MSKATFDTDERLSEEYRIDEGVDITFIADGEYTFYSPPPPQWEWCVGGDWTFIYRVQTGPHWLGRFLQKWLLDIHWRKV